MKRFYSTLVLALILIFLSGAVFAQILNDPHQRYVVARVPVPMTCLVSEYSVSAATTPKKTAVALYQVIRFAFAYEEATDATNAFYKDQFGYSPGNLRINQYTKTLAIVPLTVEEMQGSKGQVILENIKINYTPLIRDLIRFRSTTTQYDDANPAIQHDKVKNMLQPLVSGYQMQVTDIQDGC